MADQISHRADIESLVSIIKQHDLQQLLVQEREILQQLQTVSSEKNNALTQLQARLNEITDDHRRQFAQSEETKKLEIANKKLVESYSKNDLLRVELNNCKMRMHELTQQLQTISSEKNNEPTQLQTKLDELADDNHRQLCQARAQLQQVLMESSEKENMLGETNKKLEELRIENDKLSEKLKCYQIELLESRELASMTKIRQLEELDRTEEVNAIMLQLQKEIAAIAENIRKLGKTVLAEHIKSLQAVSVAIAENISKQTKAAMCSN